MIKRFQITFIFFIQFLDFKFLKPIIDLIYDKSIEIYLRYELFSVTKVTNLVALKKSVKSKLMIQYGFIFLTFIFKLFLFPLLVNT